MNKRIERLGRKIADRYVIQRPLGEGGMATVYLAEDVRHGRQVALKVLRPELSAAIGSERFLREIRLTANLHHPHIIQLHDSGEVEGLLYYVMPLVEGETLREKLDREGQLPLDEVVSIARSVARALDYAHRQGVVHRDIKPENILLQDGAPMVADFGVARAVSRGVGERLTQTGASLGTPTYMSPEQASGEETVDARSDVYSLGCVVWEMLAGQPPFTGRGPRAVIARHLMDPVPRLRTLRPALGEDVERTLEQALAKTPADRFGTAESFVDALAGAGAPRRLTHRPRLLSGVRSRRVLPLVAALVAVCAAGWWVSTLQGGGGLQRLAVLPPTNLGTDPEQDYFIQGIHDALITELGQVGFAVIGRTSVMRYRDAEASIREIAQELEVNAVLESTVLWAEDSVRIAARVVDGDSETLRWSGSFQDEARNVIAVYRNLSDTMVKELQLALEPAAAERLAGAESVDPATYDAYLKGQYQWYRLSPEGFDRALEYFELALDRSPGYSAAHAGISRVWIGRLQIGVTPPGEAASRARAAALRAIESDPALADAHYSLALVRTWADWDWERGEAEFRRALEINPNYADAHAHYSHLLFVLGRTEEGMEHIHQALGLDPFNALFRGLYGAALLFEGRYDEVIRYSLESAEAGMDHPLARGHLISAYEARGDYEEALSRRQAQFGTSGDTAVERAVARGYAEGGYTDALRRVAEVLEERSRTTYVPPLTLAVAWVKASDFDRALRWLELGYESRDPNMRYIGVHPNFQPLRDDPRFQELLQRMGLPG